jgi:hypothetical protein
MGSYETLFSQWRKTIAYSNIFDYPLSEGEVYDFLLSRTVIPRHTFTQWIEKNTAKLLQEFDHHEGLWLQKGRLPVISTRHHRNRYSTKKLKQAKWLTWLFFLQPWVRLIGVTGAVAAQNATQEDDIDLFIITSPNRQWLTRALILSVLALIRRRYHLNRKNPRPAYCLNHILTTDKLSVAPHDMYIANDIARMRVVWERTDTYRSFLRANPWIGLYLANWWADKFAALHLDHVAQPSLITRLGEQLLTQSKIIRQVWFIVSAPLRTPWVVLDWVLDGANTLAYRLQRKKSPNLQLNHHLRDNRGWILREYYLALLNR